MMEFGLNSKMESNTLVVYVVLPKEKMPQYEYAYYLIKDGERILTKWYSASYEERFVLEESGTYFVTCFVRYIEDRNNITSKHTQLYIYPRRGEEESVVYDKRSLLERQFSIYSQIKDGILECEVCPVDNNFVNLEFAFYLMKEFEKKEMTSYSPYNKIKFPLTMPGIYSIKCFVRQGEELLTKTSKFHGYKMDSPSGLEKDICEQFWGGAIQLSSFESAVYRFLLSSNSRFTSQYFIK